jgi:hypothetical protein
MPANRKKTPLSKFPLRLMPSVRRAAASFSEKEGVSLNQFINVAVAEKLAHLQHEEWLARRPKASESAIASALRILDRPGRQLPAEEDRLPKGYKPVRRRYAEQATSGKAR